MLGSGSPSGPDYVLALSQVQGMSKPALQELQDDESKLDDYVKSLDQIKRLYEEKEMLMASNKSLAVYNLEQEPVLKSKKEGLGEKQREAIALIAQLKQTRSRLESLHGNYKPEVLHSLLQVSSSEAEKESENVAEDFLSNKTQHVDAFLETFLEKRKIYHLRNVKLTKMKEILERKSSTPNRKAPPPPNVPYAVTNPQAVAASSSGWGQQGVGNLPYPLHPGAGMPPGPPPFR